MKRKLIVVVTIFAMIAAMMPSLAFARIPTQYDSFTQMKIGINTIAEKNYNNKTDLCAGEFVAEEDGKYIVTIRNSGSESAYVYIADYGLATIQRSFIRTDDPPKSSKSISLKEGEKIYVYCDNTMELSILVQSVYNGPMKLDKII